MMINWIRKILGIISIEENLNKIYLENSKANESILNIISDSSKGILDLENKINELNPKEKIITLEEELPLLTNFKINNDLSFLAISPEMLNTEFTCVTTEKSNSGFLSALAGGAMQGAALEYSTRGLFKATTDVKNLMQYSNGTYSSISTSAGKFSNHHGFVNTGLLNFTPLIAFQIATFITSQVHLQQISEKLSKINNQIKDLLKFHQYERLAKLHYINERLIQYSNRKSFTLEDFIVFENFKYELAVIKEESFSYCQSKIHELGNKYKLSDQNENTNWRQKTVTKFGNTFEKSKKEMEKFVNEFNESNLLSYAKISLNAERLYHLFLYLELVANMKVKNLDSDRIGKINELYNSFKDQLNIITRSHELNENLQTFKEFINKYGKEKENNAMNIMIFNNKDEVGQHSIILEESFKEFEKIYHDKIDTKSQKQLIDSFDEKIEIIIDNRANQEIIYTKK